MNDTSKQLVAAAEAELDGIDPEVSARVPVAVAAILRGLSVVLYSSGQAAIEPGELATLADDIEDGGE